MGIIELSHIEKSYPATEGRLQVLRDISLSVQPGEIYGVVGKSGAGKSTLIRCINLLERPDKGRVVVADQELTVLSPRHLRTARHQIGMIFQHFNLLSSRTVYENIAFPLELIQRTKQQIKITVMPLLELTGLMDKKDVYPSQLSGGQKQRVAIARALASQPRVLLCDEATSALDPQTTQAILQLLKDINKRLGLTIMLITHEMDVIKQIADRVALLDDGQIIEEAETTKFFLHAKTSMAKDFVKSCLRHDLPPVLQNVIKPAPVTDGNTLLRIVFHGHATQEPLISYITQKLQITLNILQANIEFLRNTPIGIMLVEVVGDAGQLHNMTEYLESKNINVETIGYVERDAIRTL